MAAYLFIVAFFTIMAVELLFFSESPDHIMYNDGTPKTKKIVLKHEDSAREKRSDTMDIDL